MGLTTVRELRIPIKPTLNPMRSVMSVTMTTTTIELLTTLTHVRKGKLVGQVHQELTMIVMAAETQMKTLMMTTIRFLTT